MTPKKFFVCAGVGVDKTSPLNAFDGALIEAGIDRSNLVPVSSILPVGAQQVPPPDLAAGQITFCVLARCDGVGGEQISAALGWSFCRDDSGIATYGLVAEAKGNVDEQGVRELALGRLEQMAKVRKLTLIEPNIQSVSLSPDSTDKFSSVVVALVFVQ